MITKRIVTPLCDRSIEHMTHIRLSHWVKDEQVSNICFLHFDILFSSSERKMSKRIFTPLFDGSMKHDTCQSHFRSLRKIVSGYVRTRTSAVEKNAQETILLCFIFFPRLLQIFSMTWEFAKITFCSQLSCGCNPINAK